MLLPGTPTVLPPGLPGAPCVLQPCYCQVCQVHLVCYSLATTTLTVGHDGALGEEVALVVPRPEPGP